jgi:hypothetical protein
VISQLTPDEEKEFCDFLANQYGGYGKSSGMCVSWDNQADCLEEEKDSTCPAKVSAAKACVRAYAMGGCATTTVPAECAALPAGCWD